MRRTGLAAVMLLATAPAFAQSEDALRQRFEGRAVMVRIDMPATAEGVDVEPGSEQPLDSSSYAYRLKSHGAAIRAGERVMVTKVKVKDKLIEFQLAGGGFGTFANGPAGSVYIPRAEKTAREKELERQVRDEKDAQKKRQMQDELRDLRRQREREDSRNRAVAEAATEVRRETDRRRALESGSRFNVRYRNGVPVAALTPQGLMRALAEYVDFEGGYGGNTGAGAAPAPAPGGGPLRKGLSWDEVTGLLGDPQTSTDGSEGSLKTKKAVFVSGPDRIEALFIEGVLVRYTISSK